MAPLLRTASAAIAALSGLTHALYENGSVIAPCDSVLYCQGEILKAIELASPFKDSKTYVDMPTVKPLDEVIAAFNKLKKPITNNTELNDFLKTYYAPAGGELEAVPQDELKVDPVFLDKINDTVIKEFITKVIDIWPDLTRRYVGAGSKNCTDCQTSFIEVNRTFVVAGGRFREPYYWDSYWIVEGLLRTGGSFVEITKNTIENFLDFIETIGFIPNGARKYYLNRSQPPLLSQMIRLYVEHTNDTSVLARAIPLLIKEHDFFINNRSVTIKAQNGTSYTLQQYHVRNTQPRPESYREDYITANNASYYSASGKIYPEPRPLNESERAELYSNLASGAESGWDYGTRYLARPQDAARDDYFPLRSLAVNSIVPIDLNAILYWNEITIGNFLNRTGNSTGASAWHKLAAKRSEAMTATMWNATLWSYFDYNLTSSSQNIYVPRDPDALDIETATAPEGQQVIFNIAQMYPFWTGAAPAGLKHNPLAVKQAYARVAAYLDVRKGAIPATNFRTGQQWDQPNVWPNLMHVLMDGLVRTPPTFGEDDPAYKDVQALALRLGQRYLDSTFCTWWATGGSTSATPKLQGVGDKANGTMFEKYADNSTNLAGSGGEYEVVEGFGWTNGVLIWAADTFGSKLTRPDCGNITAAHVTPGKRAVELDIRDAQFVKRFRH